VRLAARQDSSRFPSVQAVVASCRIVTCATASAGNRAGTTGTNIGNAYRKWACSAAAVLCLRDHPTGQNSRARLENTHGQGKALTILADQFARAVDDRRKRATAVQRDRCSHGSRRGAGEPDAALATTGLSLGRALGKSECLGSSTAPACVGRLSLSPVPVIGHPRLLRCLRRWSHRCNVGCPSPASETNWRRRPLQPPLGVGRYEGPERFLSRRARSTALQSSSRRPLHLPIRVWCSHTPTAPAAGNAVRTRHRVPPVPTPEQRKKTQKIRSQGTSVS